jgi:hypothetical protein
VLARWHRSRQAAPAGRAHSPVRGTCATPQAGAGRLELSSRS